MIRALVNLYDKLNEQGLVERLGWSGSKVLYGIDLNEDGKPTGIVPLDYKVKPGKKGEKESRIPVPKIVNVPEQPVRSSNTAPFFLCDTALYLLGYQKPTAKKDEIGKFHASKKLHIDFLGNVDSPAARAVCKFYENWVPDDIGKYPFFMEDVKALETSKYMFFYDGKPVTEDKKIADAWQKYYDEKDASEERDICMVTNEEQPKAQIHAKIKNIKGGSSMGQPLISFNDRSAFFSYCQDRDSAVTFGKYTAFAYATALNYLLNDREHVRFIGNSTVVYWAENADPRYQNAIESALFGFFNGDPIDLDGVTELQKDVKFYILGLTPNSGRLAVSFFYENSFGKFLDNIQSFYDDFAIEKPAFIEENYIPLWRLLKETVPPMSKDDASSLPLPGLMSEAILLNKRYPVSFINGIMARIRAENNVSYRKAAAIKGYYSRNAGKNFPKEILCMGLNKETHETAYVLGRLFAVYEYLQDVAIKNIVTSITDKYFSSACTSPAHVFPRLMNLGKKHLRKIKDRSISVYFSKEIEGLLSMLDEPIPMRFSTEQKCVFQLGYYMQKQERYKGKKDKEEENVE